MPDSFMCWEQSKEPNKVPALSPTFQIILTYPDSPNHLSFKTQLNASLPQSPSAQIRMSILTAVCQYFSDMSLFALYLKDLISPKR